MRRFSVYLIAFYFASTVLVTASVVHKIAGVFPGGDSAYGCFKLDPTVKHPPQFREAQRRDFEMVLPQRIAERPLQVSRRHTTIEITPDRYEPDLALPDDRAPPLLT